MRIIGSLQELSLHSNSVGSLRSNADVRLKGASRPNPTQRRAGLTGHLMPDFNTIANFRKDNNKAMRGACGYYVVLCQQLGLFGENCIGRQEDVMAQVNSLLVERLNSS